MTDRTQFEAMLEALINEDQETAKEIFHNIVVAKSREIYEELLESDFMEEEEVPADPAAAPAEMPVAEESDEEDDSEEDDSEDDGEVGGDAGDDFVSDIDGEEDGESDDGAIEDRVMDLEDALDELKAEFEQLMAGEDDMGGDDMGDMDDMGGDDEFGAEPDMGGDELDAMMEYVDKVALPKHGDNGANAKSVVAGKNDMGGTSANIAKSFSTEKGGTQGGLAKPTTTKQDAGNINVPGGNAGKTAFKKKEPGHGAEKKGSGDTAPDRKSLIGSRK